MAGLMTQWIHKSVGKSRLKWYKLENILLLDIEKTLNNRPLYHLEDNIQVPVVTPNLLVYGEEIFNPYNDIDSVKKGREQNISEVVNETHGKEEKWKN